MEAPVGWREKPEKVRMSDEELAEEQRSCEAVIEKYGGDPYNYPYSQGMVRDSREQLKFVVEARNARAEARTLRADRAALLGTIKQFLRDEYPEGTAGASLFVQRLEVTVRMIDTGGGRTVRDVVNWLRERSGACI